MLLLSLLLLLLLLPFATFAMLLQHFTPCALLTAKGKLFCERANFHSCCNSNNYASNFPTHSECRSISVYVTVCVCWCCAANIEAKKMPQHFNFSCGHSNNNNNLKVPLLQRVSWKQKQVSEHSAGKCMETWLNLTLLRFGSPWFTTPRLNSPRSASSRHGLWPETKLHNQCKFGALNDRVEQHADITANNLDHGN